MESDFLPNEHKRVDRGMRGGTYFSFLAKKNVPMNSGRLTFARLNKFTLARSYTPTSRNEYEYY